MGDTNFPQTRTIDPFAGFYSDITSRLLQGVTKGRDCLLTPNSFQVEEILGDSTAVNVIDGFVVMDNTLIRGTSSSFEVDFEDVDFYSAGSIWDTAGYYYLCVNYIYQRTRPAPQALFRILKPNQRNLIDLSSDNFLIKVVQVISVGAGYEISALYDYDPDPVYSDHRREYVHIYAAVYETLPSTFTRSEDEGRIIYVLDEGELYFGGISAWEIFTENRQTINTTGCTVGQLVYLGAGGITLPAISTGYNTLADSGVLVVGVIGKVALYGLVPDVPIEPGRTITLGDRVYLSSTTAGTISDLPSSPIQFVGRCVEAGVHGVSCDIWFMPDPLQPHAASHVDGMDDVQDATAAQKGLMTAAYGTKLDGIEALADVTDFANVQAALAAATSAINFNLQDFVDVGAITAHGELNMSTNIISNVVNPVANQDAATKLYVDSLASGLDIKDPVRLATVAALPACTAAGEGVGKTLTADVNGALSIDAVATANTNRVLVKNQIDTTSNGIYIVTNKGDAGAKFVLTRATDADEDTEVLKGMYVFVTAGVTLIGTAWVLKDNADPDIDPQEFAQFSFATTFVEDDVYGAGWDGDTAHSPSQNAVYDVFNSHKDRHDPQDGADPLDCAAPLELAAVQASAEGTAHSFARSDHAHQIQHGITNNHLVTVDGAPNNLEYARFTVNGIEGRTESEFKADLDVGFASNTKVWFYQNVAPTGWTLDATPSDDLLAVKGGAQAYNAAGGTGAGTWTVAGLTKNDHTHARGSYAGPSHTHARGSYLGPWHTHGVGTFKFTVGDVDGTYLNLRDAAGGSSRVLEREDTQIGTGAFEKRYYISGTNTFYTTSGTGTADGSGNGAVTGTSAAGGTQAVTGTSAGQSNSTISSSGAWRPKARLGIICTKD